jgi:hypothetical protein
LQVRTISQSTSQPHRSRLLSKFNFWKTATKTFFFKLISKNPFSSLLRSTLAWKPNKLSFWRHDFDFNVYPTSYQQIVSVFPHSFISYQDKTSDRHFGALVLFSFDLNKLSKDFRDVVIIGLKLNLETKTHLFSPFRLRLWMHHVNTLFLLNFTVLKIVSYNENQEILYLLECYVIKAPISLINSRQKIERDVVTLYLWA